MRNLSVLMTFLLVAMTTYTHAQIQKVTNLTVAQSIALSTNKLIIIDFTASWCGPCKKMERELWSSEEFKALGDKFVFLQLDIDENGTVASAYGVTGIPRVMVMTAGEDILYDNTGFSTANQYMSRFNIFPSDNKELNESIVKVVNKKNPEPVSLFEVGEQFRLSANKVKDNSIKGNFIRTSNTYFKKAGKTAKSKELKQLIEVAYVHNEVENSRFKKAMKKLAKLDKKPAVSENVTEYRKFVKAYCYQKEGNTVASQKLKKEIKNKKWLALLN